MSRMLSADDYKKDSMDRIKSHFDDNPALRQDPRFECVFNRLCRSAAGNENQPKPWNSSTFMASAYPFFTHLQGFPPLSTDICNLQPLSLVPGPPFWLHQSNVLPR